MKVSIISSLWKSVKA